MALGKKIVSPLNLRYAEKIVDAAGIIDEETALCLIRAFAVVPRDQFIPSNLVHRVHDDISLPIGYSQTQFKPSVLARMLGVIGVRPGMRVLHIGCGSGYSSAVMASAGAMVYAVEKVGMLAQRTRKLLDALGYQNVLINRGEGKKGWLEHAPYDAIVVTTVFKEIEKEMFSQLVIPGGRMVAPIGDENSQVLTLWEAKQEDEFLSYKLESIRL
jgi:protein-L-isoaspartate(D-aspartate) O-methyltransferase